jgi:hypothetical protein
MLPSDYRWEEQWGGQALFLDGVAPYPCRCAYWAPLPGGGGILLHWGVRDGMPNQRVFATEGGAMRFVEAWAAKWDTEIRKIVANKGRDYDVGVPAPGVVKEAASRDYARRRGHRKDWWKEKPLAK